LELDKPTLQGGLYAYNAVLIGTGLIDYFQFDFTKDGTVTLGWPVAIFMSIVLGPITLLIGLYIQYRLLGGMTFPFLLLPFNIVMLGVLLCAKLWDPTIIADQVLANVVDSDGTRFRVCQVIFNSLSRIFLVDGVIPGVLILIGTFPCSRILCLSLVMGALLSSLLSLFVFDEYTSYLNGGYAGYNPALTVAGIFYYFVPTWKLTGLAFFWIMVTMISQAVVGLVLEAL
jgi:urea transporter